MNRHADAASRATDGAALIIVLAFVVLLTGLVVAFLSRTTSERRTAQSSFDQANANQLALSATELLISDFVQEIVSGSTVTTGNSGGVMYMPTSVSNIVPQVSGTPPPVGGVNPVPNLIRRSVNPDAIPLPGVVSRASAVNSTSSSLNGHAVTTVRWNSHYLIPKANTTDDSVPVGDFIAPDWVIVTRNGPVRFAAWDANLKDSTATNASYAVARYAYAVYDEGGLLDINAAGFPTAGSPPSVADLGRKGVLALADLTALQTSPSSSYVTNTVIDRLVGWRNYQTMLLSGNFPSSFSFTAATTSNFLNYFLGAARTGTSADFGTVAAAPAGSTRTDQAVVTRQQLVKLRADTGAGAASMLQYLGTFSREVNAPTWRPNSFSSSTAYPLASRVALSNLTPVVSGATSASIRTNFGLRWSSDHWQYVGTGTGNTVQQAISPPVAGTAPDFFQILSFARTSSTGVIPTIAETLSIGASIIDQYDSDTTTTRIEYAVPTGRGNQTTPAYIWGMEDVAPPVPATAPASAPGGVVNRALRNVGEIGYAFRNSNPGTTIDFRTAGPTPFLPSATNLDAGLLDMLTYNTAPLRSGIISLNTRNAPVLASVIMGALPTNSSASGISRANALTAASNFVAETTNLAVGHGPALSRADVTRLASVATGAPFSTNEESRESIARALAEVGQTRTWGLMIDMIAQTGRYSRAANSLADFTVQGEQRYWIHVAIDRFTGQVIDRQIEAVNE